MNKEEDYRNLAGNITMFTDNTSFYEDWLVIQQYVDDWLDEIDNLQQENAELKSVIKEAKEYINKHIRIDDEYPAYMEMLKTEKDELLQILDKGEKQC